MSSIPEIMTIGEMIDSAFGDPDRNVVHHKLIQAILFLLARQLRLLDRRVKIELCANADFYSSDSSILVSEVKIHANVKKKRRAPRSGSTGRSIGAISTPKGKGPRDIETSVTGSQPRKVTGDRDIGATGMGRESQLKSTTGRDIGDSGRGGTTTKAHERTGDKISATSSGKTVSKSETVDGRALPQIQEKSQLGKRLVAASERSFTDDQSSSLKSLEKTSTEKSSGEKTSPDKSSTEKSSTDKSSTEQTSTEKSSTEKSSTEKSSTQKSTDKSSSYKSSTEKSTTDKTTSESPTEKTTTSFDKSSSGDKTTTAMSATEKTTSSDISSTQKSTDKTSTEKSSTDKSTTEKSTDKSTTEKSSTDKSTTEKSSTDKSTTDKSSSAKATSTSTDKTSTSGKTTTEKTTTSSSAKATTSTSAKYAPRHRRKISEYEMQKEQELRIIRQRTDSREEHEKTPTPMASLSSLEVQYEKLLVVERVSSEEAKARTGRLQGEMRGAAPRLSIVTQEEFSKLATVVKSLQEKFDPVGAADFPENIQLMQELRKGASLTDAMAALQLSARLEAAEKTLERMTGLVTDLASKYPDIDLTEFTEKAEPATEVLYHGAPGPSSQVPPALSKTAAFKQPPKPQKSKIKAKDAESIMETISLPPSTPDEEVRPEVAVIIEEEKENPDWITADELDTALQEVYDKLISTLNTTINKNKTSADSALKIAARLESKLNASLDLGTRMTDLETLVAQYADQINTLDTGLSSQMTNYQEQLTQMQHDLESGLENMAEALASTGGDTTAVAELNGHFTNLQMDFETTATRQNELRDIQIALRSDLEDLRREIELLRGTKSDRDEVADALRDKVGLGTLNGLVSLVQFDAVRGDLEQKIGAAYDKFNNQEIVWQKAIDDLLRELGEKADRTQVMFLKDDIQMNIEKLRKRIQDMLDIVGEPQAAAVAKKLHRDTNCLSCSTPAYMKLEEANKLPALPAMPGIRPPTLGAESPPKLEDGVCYPGLPIPHARNSRAHVCNRYCGGSHTKIPTTVSRAPPGMIINPAVNTVVKTDEKFIKKPCVQCNVKPKVAKDMPPCKHSESLSENVVKEDDFGSDMTPEDFRMTSLNTAGSGDAENSTPPAHTVDED